MRIRRTVRLVVVVLTCVLLWAVLWWLLPGAAPVRANPGALFVTVAGSGSACSQAAPCALQTALAQAADGDEIYLGSGTYTGSGDAVATLARSVTVYGGWDGAAGGQVVRDPSAYPSMVDGQGQRRGMYINSGLTVALEGLTIRNGWVVGNGGGLYASGVALTLRKMTFEGNVITSTTYVHGGGAFAEEGTVLVEASTFRHNWGYGKKSSYGAGLGISRTLVATVTGCLFEHNDAWDGSALWLNGVGWGETRFLLSDSRFIENGGGYSGGRSYGGYAAAIEIGIARARIERNIFRGNFAGNDYGAAGIFGGELTLTGNQIVGNSNGGAAGLYLSGVRPFTATNNIIAGNEAGWLQGPAVRVRQSSGQFVQNTIARTIGGSGLQVDLGSSVWLTNTLVVSHTVGITVGAGSTVTMEATMWGSGEWRNETDSAGDGSLFMGTVYVRGTPDFVSPAVGDYHIGGGSMAIDTGVATDVNVDIDGDARPSGSGYDIGADEYTGMVARRWIYLPAVRRAR